MTLKSLGLGVALMVGTAAIAHADEPLRLRPAFSCDVAFAKIEGYVVGRGLPDGLPAGITGADLLDDDYARWLADPKSSFFNWVNFHGCAATDRTQIVPKQLTSAQVRAFRNAWRGPGSTDSAAAAEAPASLAPSAANVDQSCKRNTTSMQAFNACRNEAQANWETVKLEWSATPIEWRRFCTTHIPYSVGQQPTYFAHLTLAYLAQCFATYAVPPDQASSAPFRP
jgi:hypothetical protein